MEYFCSKIQMMIHLQIQVNSKRGKHILNVISLATVHSQKLLGEQKGGDFKSLKVLKLCIQSYVTK